MAIATPTVLDSLSETSTATTITSNSLSPAANALVIVAFATQGGSAMLPASIGDTFSPNLSWTKYEIENASGSRASIAVFWALTGATPGSGTVTVTAASNNRRILSVSQVASGFNAAAPIVQTKTGFDTTAASLTLDGTPVASSLVMGFLSIRGTSPLATPGANYTQLAEFTAVSATQNVEYDLESATTTVNWTVESGTWLQTAMVAIEIAAAAGGATRHFMHYARMRQ